MLSEINHVTYNTSNCRITTPKDIKKSIYFLLHRIITSARNTEYVQVTDNLYIKLTGDADEYICSIYYRRGNDMIPVAISFGTKNANNTANVWRYAENFYIQTIGDKVKRIPVKAPIILDVAIPAPVPMEVYGMTGDITKCIGWMMLSPKSILRQ